MSPIEKRLYTVRARMATASLRVRRSPNSELEERKEVHAVAKREYEAVLLQYEIESRLEKMEYPITVDHAATLCALIEAKAK